MGIFKDNNKFDNPIVCYLLMNDYKYTKRVGFSGYERKYGTFVISINLERDIIAIAHQSWDDDIPLLDGEI